MSEDSQAPDPTDEHPPEEPEPEEAILDVELGPEDADPILDVVLDESPEVGGEAGPGQAVGPPPPAQVGEGKQAPCGPVAAAGELPPVDEAEELPAVDQETVEYAQAERLEAACAYAKQPFLVIAAPREGGAYEVVDAQALPPGSQIGQPAGTGRTLKGVFYLERYRGCPHCGAGGLILCQTCGVISCGATDKRTGQFLPCPACGSGGPVQQSKAGWSVSALGKGKGGRAKDGWA